MTPNKVSSLEKSIGFVIQFRLVFMSLMGLLIGLSGVYTLKNLSIDNSLGIWFLEEDPSYQAYIEYQETYGSDEIFMVMLPVPNALDKDQIDQLEALNTALDKLPFVETAYSLAKAKYPVIVGKKLRFRPLYEEKRSEKALKIYGKTCLRWCSSWCQKIIKICSSMCNSDQLQILKKTERTLPKR